MHNNTDLQLDIEVDVPEITRLRNYANSLQDANKDLLERVNQLEESQCGAISIREGRLLQDEVDHLRRLLDQVDSKVQAADASKGIIDQQLRTSKQREADLEEKLLVAQRAKGYESEEVGRLNCENVDLRRQVQDLQTQIEGMQRINSATSDIQKENKDLATTVTTLKAMTERLREKARDERDRLANELRSAKDQYELKIHSLAEALDAERSTVLEAKQVMDKEISRFSIMEDQIVSNGREMEREKNINDELKRQITEIQRRMDQEIEKHRNKDETVKQLHVEIDRRQAQAECSRTTQAAEKAAFRRQREELSGERSDLLNRLQGLQEELSGIAKRDAEQQAATAEAARLERLVAELKDKLDQTQGEKAELEGRLQHAFTEMKRLGEGISQDYSEMKTAKEGYQLEVDHLSQAVAHLQGEKKQTRSSSWP